MTNTAAVDVDIPMTEVLEQVEALAAADGKASGSHVGGWTAEGARHCITLSDDGDPMWVEMFGASPPFSGEWADGLTPYALIEDELGMDWYSFAEWEIEEVTAAYEQAFYDAHDAEVLRMAAYHAAEN